MLYKLTDENARTYGGCQWGEGVTHEGTGEGELCGPGWIHAYTDPLLAVLLNPVHADFKSPRLWECEGAVVKTDHGLKVGCNPLTVIREIPLPAITTKQRIRFAILCGQQVCHDAAWCAWAERWLSGEDRSSRAARVAAWAEAWAAAEAAEAAWAAAWATSRAEARAAARAAAWAAETASAAWATSRAEARAAEVAETSIDFAALAHEAIEG